MTGEHWLTAELADEWIRKAREGAAARPPRAAGGFPERGPLKGVALQIQCCECCDGLQLFVGEKQQNIAIETTEDLILAVQFAEQDYPHPA